VKGDGSDWIERKVQERYPRAEVHARPTPDAQGYEFSVTMPGRGGEPNAATYYVGDPARSPILRLLLSRQRRPRRADPPQDAA
jgi:hypothetical protein